MSAGHTPGPWVIEEEPLRIEVCAGDYAVVSQHRYAYCSTHMGSIADVMSGRGFDPEDRPEVIAGNARQMADLRLIAAAPELLALVIQYRDDLHFPPAADSIERRLTAINAAIAKATGGKP